MANKKRLNKSGSSMKPTIFAGVLVAMVQPELLPGMAIGVAAVLAPRFIPNLEDTLRPHLKKVVRAGLMATLRGIGLPLAETAARAGFTSLRRTIRPARRSTRQRRSPA